MVQMTLPKNSQMRTGKTWPKPETGGKMRKFQIYRWNPDDGENPRVDTYCVDTYRAGPDADLPAVLPRGHLRVLRDEY